MAAISLALALGIAVVPWLRKPPEIPPGPTGFQIELQNQLMASRLIHHLMTEETRKDPQRLARHEATVYSQFGEDGIIAEIFRRIGTTNRYFVEFGSGDGNENNSALLLQGGWSGLWIDAEQKFIDAARAKYASQVSAGRLSLQASFVTAENIEGLLESVGVPDTPDLLSIDIDRNDYWVWKAIERVRPRVVVVEYNAIFAPGTSWVVDYQATTSWDGTSHFGASLTALEGLGREKGYALVGCNLIGTNAFFVRQDLADDKFAMPYTAANHHQPPRYFLVWYKGGHPRRVGPTGRLSF